jgi:malonyl CoA-acyl carrier protein transacylase
MTKHSEDNNDNNSTDGDELLTDRIDERRRAEQQRLLTEIAQSTQDASDELRLMNDNVENLTREVHGTKEAIKSLTDVLRKYFDNRNQDKNHNNKA